MGETLKIFGGGGRLAKSCKSGRGALARRGALTREDTVHDCSYIKTVLHKYHVHVQASVLRRKYLNIFLFQVSKYGFDEQVGPMNFDSRGSNTTQRPHSDSTNAEIDKRAKELVLAAEKRTYEILKAHKADLERVKLYFHCIYMNDFFKFLCSCTIWSIDTLGSASTHWPRTDLHARLGTAPRWGRFKLQCTLDSILLEVHAANILGIWSFNKQCFSCRKTSSIAWDSINRRQPRTHFNFLYI